MSRWRISENGEFRTAYLALDRELPGLLTTKYEEYLVHKIENTRRQLAFEGSFIIYLSHLNLAIVIDGTEIGIAT